MYVMDTKLDKRLYGLRDELSSLTLEYLRKCSVSINQNKRLIVKKTVSCFLLNTFYNVMRGVTKKGITLNKSHYSKTPILNGRATNRKVSYKYTRILLDFLSSEGYLTLFKGGVGEYGIVKGKWGPLSYESGYVELSNKLVNLYHKYTYDYEKDIRPINFNVLIVHDLTGNDVTFRMDDFYRDIVERNLSYNKLSLSVEVERRGRLHDVQIHKVLNGKTKNKGGRNHMSNEGIQNLSKKERQQLTINGNETVIYDYQGFEPSIAYSMCQEVYTEGDPYNLDITGYDPKVSRKLCKLFLLIMFNIKNPRGLTSAINSMIQKEFNVDKLYSTGKIPSKRIDTKQIINLIEEKHYLIKHMFYGNFPTEPMYVGSLITDYVIEYFTQRGILVLPVFDEFIIEEKYEDKLVSAMRDGYQNILGFTDNCQIRKEK